MAVAGGIGWKVGRYVGAGIVVGPIVGAAASGRPNDRGSCRGGIDTAGPAGIGPAAKALYGDCTGPDGYGAIVGCIGVGIDVRIGIDIGVGIGVDIGREAIITAPGIEAPAGSGCIAGGSGPPGDWRTARAGAASGRPASDITGSPVGEVVG